MAVYFTKPIPRPALWGGKLLKEYFQYPDFPDNIGQSWAFSAQDGASNLIEGGEYAGKTLADLWHEKPYIFASRYNTFPVIVSLVAPVEDLSIQIHPNAAIAAESGHAMGKNEAWYFLEAQDDGNIVYGCRAKNEVELRKMIASDRWNDLVQLLPVRRGDFVYLPAGILHALRKGSIVYEIQQATDITYRFFDYHRKGTDGKERDLHIEQAIRCMNFNLNEDCAHSSQIDDYLPHGTLTKLVCNDSFCVRKLVLNREETLVFDGYQLMTVCNGGGRVDGLPLHIGQSFLVPSKNKILLEGQMTILMTGER